MPIASINTRSIGWVERSETHRTHAPSHREAPNKKRPRFPEGVQVCLQGRWFDGFRDRQASVPNLQGRTAVTLPILPRYFTQETRNPDAGQG